MCMRRELEGGLCRQRNRKHLVCLVCGGEERDRHSCILRFASTLSRYRSYKVLTYFIHYQLGVERLLLEMRSEVSADLSPCRSPELD